MTTYKVFTSTTTAGDGVGTIDIPVEGKIQGVAWHIHGLAPAGGICGGRYELSFASSSGFATNDTRSSISQIGYASEGVANSEFFVNHYTAVPDVVLNPGERLHLHHDPGTAPTSIEVSCFIYVEDRSPQARRVRQ